MAERGHPSAAPANAASKPAAAANLSLDLLAVSVMLLLCVSWGLQQVAVKIALPELPPLFQAGVRSLGASVMVLAWGLWRGWSVLARNGTGWSGLAAGVLFGIEFLLLYLALQWTDSTRAVLFLYTAPFWVALGALLFLPGDRLKRHQWAGLVLAFIGVAWAMGAGRGVAASGAGSVAAAASGHGAGLGDALALLAGLMWGATTLVIKATRLKTAHFSQILLYQLGVSGVMLIVASWLGGEAARWPLSVAQVSAQAWWSLAYQTFWVAGVTFLMWFALISRYSVSHLSSFTFLTPIIGIAAGSLMLGESLTLMTILASALVIAGLAVINLPASVFARKA